VSRVPAITRRKWFTPAFIALVVAAVFAQDAIWGPDYPEVVRRLEAKYGVEEIVWQGNGRYERDTLIIDGRDVSDDCVITGDWGPLDDLAIECDGEVSYEPVDR